MSHWLYPGPVAYSQEEAACGRDVQRLDLVGVPVTAVTYLAVGHLLVFASSPSPWLGLAQDAVSGVLCAAVALLVLYQHIYVQPTPLREEPMVWGVQQVFGRWVFLTRQTLSLQACHTVLSFAFPEVGNTMAVIVAGFGLFVTVQFATLVHYHPHYIQVCNMWAAKDVPFRELMLWLHLPAGVLGVLDVLYVKDRQAVLSSTPAGNTIALFVSAYAIMYVTVLRYNHSRTGYWPYDVMEPLGKDWKKWVVFIGFQGLILGLFIVSAFAAVYSYRLFR
eukprot:TRINITY_DN21993_c0_g2_i2.p1 TRINITY_DN21993_c0_g2~~TRINITY_DN21993_c0_g2_i2.p1  ORF type:complete len:277 (+),score=101.83 TRINITY_DN21993_c0_g2_i2:682-1512(+)